MPTFTTTRAVDRLCALASRESALREEADWHRPAYAALAAQAKRDGLSDRTLGALLEDAHAPIKRTQATRDAIWGNAFLTELNTLGVNLYDDNDVHLLAPYVEDCKRASSLTNQYVKQEGKDSLSNLRAYLADCETLADAIATLDGLVFEVDKNARLWEQVCNGLETLVGENFVPADCDTVIEAVRNLRAIEGRC
jgi:hypothetical protein